MGRDLNKQEDHDLSPLIASGHIVSHGPSTPWKDFLRYIESSRCAQPPQSEVISTVKSHYIGAVSAARAHHVQDQVLQSMTDVLDN